MEAIGLLVLFHLAAFIALPLRLTRPAVASMRRSVCAGCAYALEGLDSGAVCPECGREDPGTHEVMPRRELAWTPEIGASILVMFAVWATIAFVLPTALTAIAEMKLAAIGFNPHGVRVWLGSRSVRDAIAMTALPWVINLGCFALSNARERRIMSVLCVGITVAGAVLWGFNV